jgi:hypothetical protein
VPQTTASKLEIKLVSSLEDSAKLIADTSWTVLSNDKGDYLRFFLPNIRYKFTGYQLDGLIGVYDFKFEKFWKSLIEQNKELSEVAPLLAVAVNLAAFPKLYPTLWIKEPSLEAFTSMSRKVVDRLFEIPDSRSELFLQSNNFEVLARDFDSEFTVSQKFIGYFPKHIGYRVWLSKQYAAEPYVPPLDDKRLLPYKKLLEYMCANPVII